jgi:hypothetical protein
MLFVEITAIDGNMKWLKLLHEKRLRKKQELKEKLSLFDEITSG